MEMSLDILRSNKKNFLITAPVSGRLTSFEPILGKHFKPEKVLVELILVRLQVESRK
jgi:hypothetical protein